MTELNELTAISPIDGRYRKKVEELSKYFSEAALFKYRVLVEIEYLIELYNLRRFVRFVIAESLDNEVCLKDHFGLL